jgi:hypothetical protein
MVSLQVVIPMGIAGFIVVATVQMTRQLAIVMVVIVKMFVLVMVRHMLLAGVIVAIRIHHILASACVPPIMNRAPLMRVVIVEQIGVPVIVAKIKVVNAILVKTIM